MAYRIVYVTFRISPNLALQTNEYCAQKLWANETKSDFLKSESKLILLIDASEKFECYAILMCNCFFFLKCKSRVLLKVNEAVLNETKLNTSKLYLILNLSEVEPSTNIVYRFHYSDLFLLKQ